MYRILHPFIYFISGIIIQDLKNLRRDNFARVQLSNCHIIVLHIPVHTFTVFTHTFARYECFSLSAMSCLQDWTGNLHFTHIQSNDGDRIYLFKCSYRRGHRTMAMKRDGRDLNAKARVWEKMLKQIKLTWDYLRIQTLIAFDQLYPRSGY